MTESVSLASSRQKPPELSELFFAFLGVALSGFGGVLPWAHRMLVEQKRWLDEDQFAEALALCQFLPGPNVVNMAIIVGSRFRGALGALAAAFGLVGAPVVIMMVCGALYVRYGDVAVLQGALAGLAAGAAGLLIAMAAKMAVPLVQARQMPAIAFALLAFLAVGVLRFPLYWVVLVLAPLSIAFAWWRLR